MVKLIYGCDDVFRMESRYTISIVDCDYSSSIGSILNLDEDHQSYMPYSNPNLPLSLTINGVKVTRGSTIEFYCDSLLRRNIINKLHTLLNNVRENIYISILIADTLSGSFVLVGQIYSDRLLPYDYCEWIPNQMGEFDTKCVGYNPSGCQYKSKGVVSLNNKNYKLTYSCLTYHSPGFMGRAFEPILSEVLAQLPSENVPNCDFLVFTSSVQTLLGCGPYHIGESRIYTTNEVISAN
jgi:hypothetical protein